MTGLVRIRFDGPSAQLRISSDHLVKRGELTDVPPSVAGMLLAHPRIRVSVLEKPTRTGVGSGRASWAAYATAVGIEVTQQMSRDDIARAVATHELEADAAGHNKKEEI